MDDIYAAWLEHGADVIRRVIADKPEVFLKITALLIPAEVRVATEHKMDEAQLDVLIDAVKAEQERRRVLAAEQTKLLTIEPNDDDPLH